VTDEQWARWWRLFGPWVTGEPERARTVLHRELNAPGLALMRGFDVLDQLGQVDWKDDPGRYWPLLVEFVAGVG